MKLFYLTAFLFVLAKCDFVFGQDTTFNYTGTPQTYTVPCGVDSIIIKTWGAGGGGGGADSHNNNDGGEGGNGGGGAYATTEVAVNAGDVITIFVGAGGSGGEGCVTDTGAGTGGYGFGIGGNGGKTGPYGCSGGGGGGGGSSAVINITTGNLLVAAAGGGGGGGGGGVYEGLGLAGGGGGQDGEGNVNNGSSGGTTGINYTTDGTAGEDMTDDGGGAGGGGGGATAGGTGGTISFNYDDSGAGGGAGGNSFGITILNGTGQTPGNANDPGLCSDCATGAPGAIEYNNSFALSGGNGRVIITPVVKGASLTVQINPKDTSVCAGSSVALKASGGVTYLWSPATGLSSSTVSGPVATPVSTTTYFVTVSNGQCSTTDSSVINVAPGTAAVAGNIIPVTDTICEGGKVVFSVNSSSGTIQWQSSSNGISFTDISGATMDTFTAAGINQPVYYRIVATGTCNTDSSATATVSIAQKPGAGAATATPDNICAGGASVLEVSGSSGALQWQSSVDGISFTDIPGTTAGTYNATNINQTTYYRVKVSSACGTDSSSVQVVTVTPMPVAGIISAVKDTICSGYLGHLIVNGSSGSVQWQSSSTTGNFSNITGETNSTYKTQVLTHSVYYRIIAGNGICEDTSAIFELYVVPAPLSVFTSSDSGLVVTFNSGGSLGATTYSWSFGDNSPASNEQNPSHTYDSAGTYHVCLTVQNKTNCDYTLCQNVILYPTGITPVSSNAKWIIYPDPVSNDVFIGGNETNNKIERVELFDVLGRTVLDKNVSNISSNPLIIDVAGLTQGMYFLKISADNMSYIQSVLKQ